MKKKIFASLLVFVLTVAMSCAVLYAASTVTFDKEKLSRGVIGVKYMSTDNKKTKVLIQLGEQKYQYNVRSADKFVYFPLQLGNGEYKVGVFENIEGTKYSSVATETVSVKLDDSSKVFLNSIQIIEWSDKMNTVSLAKELTKNKPVIDDVVKKKLGICYDYSAVFASMLRSLDIRCKLIMGYTPNVKEYHAWNEVFMDGKWVTVDSTYDSQMFSAKVKTSFEKPKKDYSTTYEY